MKIENPILPGFNPDPSVVRVGNDYYLATSTFEWFPGVRIHHSTNLRDWQLIGRPLDRTGLLDMRGVPDSCGVWAPCLSYDQGTFYLVYSNVRSFDGPWKDSPNFLVTSKDMQGEWSDPVFLSSTGFDGSLFHDEDGRKWYVSMIVDHRNDQLFGGIMLQEFSEIEKKLIGRQIKIFEGTSLGKTEAPHLYQKNGFYYLVTAEGGTEYDHAVTMARSRQIQGPYEIHPKNPIITAIGDCTYPFQKCGHADLLETPTDQTFAVYLIGRPLTPGGRCILGRETVLHAMEWRADKWLYAKGEKKAPLYVDLDDDASVIAGSVTKKSQGYRHYLFDLKKLDPDFQSLRIPISEDWVSFTAKPGYLRLYGRDSLSSCFDQSLLARRLAHFQAVISIELNFYPQNFQQMAGLVCYYNTCHWHYIFLSANETGCPEVRVMSSDKYRITDHLPDGIKIKESSDLRFKAAIQRDHLQFHYAEKEGDWVSCGPSLDMSILSDDYVRDEKNRYRPAFTGSFIGICCQDLSGQRHHADFKWLKYEAFER